MNSRSNPDDKSFDSTLTPIDNELLNKIETQLGNDYQSILNSRSEGDLIHFEIRCTDIALAILNSLNKNVRFKLRLEMDEFS